jgi:hypothetical protein
MSVSAPSGVTESHNSDSASGPGHSESVSNSSTGDANQAEGSDFGQQFFGDKQQGLMEGLQGDKREQGAALQDVAKLIEDFMNGAGAEDATKDMAGKPDGGTQGTDSAQGNEPAAKGGKEMSLEELIKLITEALKLNPDQAANLKMDNEAAGMTKPSEATAA